MEKKQQFLPTLFERLLDDEPKSQTEPFDKYFYTSRTMQALVQRDIASILNTSNIETQLQENKYHWAAASVINYGVAPMIGNHADANNWSKVEKIIRDAILRFEPRIIPESLVVRPLLDKDRPSRHGIIMFEIRGLIYWDPYPIDLCIKAKYDIETESMTSF